jgi:hypothetical protein
MKTMQLVVLLGLSTLAACDKTDAPASTSKTEEKGGGPKAKDEDKDEDNGDKSDKTSKKAAPTKCPDGYVQAGELPVCVHLEGDCKLSKYDSENKRSGWDCETENRGGEIEQTFESYDSCVKTVDDVAHDKVDTNPCKYAEKGDFGGGKWESCKHTAGSDDLNLYGCLDIGDEDKHIDVNIEGVDPKGPAYKTAKTVIVLAKK